MPDSNRPEPIEFLHLGGQAIRVTSWTTDDEAGTCRLVTITRGSRDAELLDDILKQETLSLLLPGQDEIEVTVQDVDRRTFGEGQATITRFAVVFNSGEPANDGEPVERPLSLEDRVLALELEVSQLRELVRSIANATPNERL
jgi:hypothetical protein